MTSILYKKMYNRDAYVLLINRTPNKNTLLSMLFNAHNRPIISLGRGGGTAG